MDMKVTDMPVSLTIQIKAQEKLGAHEIIKQVTKRNSRFL